MTSETFTQTSGQIITNALRDARIIAAEQPIQAKDLIDGLQAINMIIKHWQTQGIHLWSETEAVLPLIPNQRKYLLGPDGDEVAIGSTFFNTTTTLEIPEPEDLTVIDPVTQLGGWTTTNSSIVTTADGLQVTNTANISGSVSRDFTVTSSNNYKVSVGNIPGTALTATAQLLNPAIEGTIQFSDTRTSFFLITPSATTVTFNYINGGSVIGDDNTISTVSFVSDNKTIFVTSTTGTTADGQAITIQGAPEILDFNPATSTQDWTAVNSTISTVNDTLEVASAGGLQGAAQYTLDVTAGNNYQIEATVTTGTSGSYTLTAFDSVGILTGTALLTTGTNTLDFTARDDTVTFEMLNTSNVVGTTNFVTSLNYRDKQSGDRIGVELDDGSRFWDNVITVDSDTQLTLANEPTGAAAVGNTVYTFSTAIARPMRLLQARFGESITATEIPVRQWSRDEYFDQPDKDSSGTVVNWYYTPTLNIGQLFVWQVANDINQVLRFTFVDPIEIPTDTDDPLEVPSEWYLPLKWAVAAELGPSRGISDNRQVILESKAATTLEQALDFDVERESMNLQPDFN